MISNNTLFIQYFETDSEDEKEDYTIKDTDALIIAGKIVKCFHYRFSLYQYIKLIGEK